jgi:hypothetical protein
VEHYDEDEVESIFEGLQDRLVASTIDAMVDQIEGLVVAFSPRNTMDAEAVVTAFTMVDRLVAEVVRRAMGSTELERHDIWLGQHVISVKRFLKSMAEDREVEVASIEKHLRDTLGARSQ